MMKSAYEISGVSLKRLYNTYIDGICWYISRVLSRNYTQLFPLISGILAGFEVSSLLKVNFPQNSTQYNFLDRLRENGKFGDFRTEHSGNTWKYIESIILKTWSHQFQWFIYLHQHSVT